MGKIVVTEFMSLDGVIENPAWTMPYWNDEIANFKAAETTPNDMLLLGRVTYEGFASVWPHRTNAEDLGAAYFNSVRKFVVSTTLTTVEWNNSELIKGDLLTELQTLKAELTENLVVHGSATLVRWLAEHDLVDTYRFLVYPELVGKGLRLWDGVTKTLNLVESRVVSTGVLALVYEPKRL